MKLRNNLITSVGTDLYPHMPTHVHTPRIFHERRISIAWRLRWAFP